MSKFERFNSHINSTDAVWITYSVKVDLPVANKLVIFILYPANGEIQYKKNENYSDIFDKKFEILIWNNRG